MKHELKVGDVVRCVDASGLSLLAQGEECTVVDREPENIKINNHMIEKKNPII